jgi:ADP-ribose pyrophosphatase YjhB (NUDIX family)
MSEPAVVAYVERNGLLLSCTRKGTGQHGVPGGKVETGETLTDALVRELFEETGLHLVSHELVYTGTHTSGRTVYAYRVQAEGDPTAREPGTSVSWVHPREIANGFGSEYHRVALRAAGFDVID